MRAATLQRRQTSHASQTRSGAKPSGVGSTVPPSAATPLQAAFADLDDAGFHRQVAVEVAEPADAHAARIEARRGRARSASFVAIESGTRGSQPAWTSSSAATSRTLRPIGPSVLSSATQTSDEGQRGTRPWLGRKPTTLFQAGGVAQAPHEVAAVGDRQHVRRQRDRGAAAAAAGRLGAVEGVAGDAEHLVEGVRAEAELRRVGLADDDAAGRLHALDHQRVVLRHVVGQQRRAERASGCPSSRRRP